MAKKAKAAPTAVTRDEPTELTAKRIAETTLPEPDTRTWLWDRSVTGEAGKLGLRIMPTGSATFALSARFPMRKVKGGAWLINEDKHATTRELMSLTGFRIGTDRLTLATTRDLRRQIGEAREKAKEWRALIKKGKDPSHEAERAHLAEAQARRDAHKAKTDEKTVDSAIEAYAKHVKRQRLRSAHEIEATLRRELLGQRPGDEPGTWENTKVTRWRGRALVSIKPEEARRLIDDIMDMGEEDLAPGRRQKRGGKWAAKHTLAICKTFFGWLSEPGSGYGIDDRSPFASIRARRVIGRLKPRKRVLSDTEIKLVWAAAEREEWHYGRLIQFLLWTGQRLTECSEARWSEFDLDKGLWVITAERMKMDTAHVVPLAPAVVQWLKTLPRFKHRDGYVFTTREGKRPFSGFSRAKSRFDKRIAELQRKDAEGAEVSPVPHFILHDLRRSVRTRFSAIPSQDIVRELAIAHVKGDLHKVYDQHAYLDERRDLFERWAAVLRNIVEPPPPNVVPFEAAKAGS
jgi:integrase